MTLHVLIIEDRSSNAPTRVLGPYKQRGLAQTDRHEWLVRKRKMPRSAALEEYESETIDTPTHSARVLPLDHPETL